MKNSFTGQDIITAFKHDLESFFLPSSEFELRIKIGGSIPMYKGKGETATIYLNTEFTKYSVSNLDDLHLLLLILSHETAHYLHQHNEYKDKTNHDTKNIESIADWYGTKLTMVIIVRGSKINEIARSLSLENLSSPERLSSISRAINILANSYFKQDSQNYDGAFARVCYCVSGVLSFIDRAMGGPKDVLRSLCYIKYMYSIINIKQLLMTPHHGKPPNTLSISSTLQIHREIQSKSKSPTLAMTPEIADYLEINFKHSDEEYKLQTELTRAEFKRQEKLLIEKGILPSN